MKIDLKELLQKIDNEADIEQVETVNFSEDGLILTQPVSIAVHLANTGSSIVLYGNAETEVEVECSRCLKTFRQPLEVELSEEFVNPSLLIRGSGETELKPGDFVYPIEKDNKIDLTEVLRQSFLLELPLKNLCSENCPGIPGQK